MLSGCVRGTNVVALDVAELALNGVGMPMAGLIE
jgi:hypothetical protein